MFAYCVNVCCLFSASSLGPAHPATQANSRRADASPQNANRSRFLSSVNTLCDNNAANGHRHATATPDDATHSVQTTSYPGLARIVGSFGGDRQAGRQAGRLPFGVWTFREARRRCWSYKQDGKKTYIIGRRLKWLRLN